MKTLSLPPLDPKLDPILDPEEARRCVELLEALVRDRTLLASLPGELRAALLMSAGRVAQPTRLERRRMLRQLRARERRRREALDRAARGATAIRAARRAEVYVPPPPISAEEAARRPGRVLGKAVACYACKAPFTRVHFFYDSMCPDCAELNYAKRHQTAPLAGRVAVVTGARVKIGYQTCLKLLRAGAGVIATTRFPRDAAARYAREADFAAWRDRLQVHGLDLRHSPSVEIFARCLTSSLDRLDILINNAAQTVRRPPAYYAHLLDAEARPAGGLPPGERAVLRGHEALTASLAAAPPAASGRADATGLAAWHAGGLGVGLRASAALSQLKYGYEDAELGAEVFPAGRTDADLQQLDLRGLNSWRMTLAEVPTAEMLELQLINSVAPFILCSRFKPLLQRSPAAERFIVNVSAMEGSFSRRTKTDKHPHTNMAKAALNMLTLTSAPDYARDGIYMNAVDTGWVTDEDPAALAERKRAELDFQPPLDIVDGAARILDPVFSGLLTGAPVWGKFLKDYKTTDW